MTAAPEFIHLRVRSEYSLLQGATRIGELAALCKDCGMPAVAVIDTNNMFGALEFSVAMADEGIQPIHGCEFATQIPDSNETAPITLLAQNEIGYRNLIKLNSKFYLGDSGSENGFDLNSIEQHSDGLICLTGGCEGMVGLLIAQRRQSEVESLLDRLIAMFPDRLYLELQRHNEAGSVLAARQAACEPGIIRIAHRLELPLVATNDVHFSRRDMFAAHDALLCIADNASVDDLEDRRRLTSEHFFKSQEEMQSVFRDIPEGRCQQCRNRPPMLLSLRDPRTDPSAIHGK